MLPHWHLQQWHRPGNCIPVEESFKRTFEQNLAHSIALSWWIWHTQQRILGRPDLVTHFLSLASRRQSAVGIKLLFVLFSSKKNLGKIVQVTGKCVRGSLTRICERSLWLLAKLYLKDRSMWTFVLSKIRFPQEPNITCCVNSCMNWQIIAPGWLASHQAIIFQQLSCICW